MNSKIDPMLAPLVEQFCVTRRALAGSRIQVGHDDIILSTTEDIRELAAQVEAATLARVEGEVDRCIEKMDERERLYRLSSPSGSTMHAYRQGEGDALTQLSEWLAREREGG